MFGICFLCGVCVYVYFPGVYECCAALLYVYECVYKCMSVCDCVCAAYVYGYMCACVCLQVCVCMSAYLYFNV